MEHGRVGFKERDIADLLTLYGVGRRATSARRCSSWPGRPNTPGWWQGYADILPHWVEPYFGLEAAASFIREYELQFVPGLLQTEDYARRGHPARQRCRRRKRSCAAPRPGSPARRSCAGRPAARCGRCSTRARCAASIGGAEVMRAQLRHLIEMCDHPAVTLQILPFSAGSHRAMGGPFTILRYTEPDLRDVVLHRAADQRPVPGQADRGRRLPRGDRGGLPAGRARRPRHLGILKDALNGLVTRRSLNAKRSPVPSEARGSSAAAAQASSGTRVGVVLVRVCLRKYAGMANRM